MMSTVDLLFWLFATLSVGGGLSMVFSKHPVSAAMFMIVSLAGVAALFVLLESFFLAVLQVLVYAGAVMVLFCLLSCCSMSVQMQPSRRSQPENRYFWFFYSRLACLFVGFPGQFK